MLPRKTKGPHQGCVFLRMIFGHLGERNEKLDIKGKFILPKRLFTFPKKKKNPGKMRQCAQPYQTWGGGSKERGKSFFNKKYTPLVNTVLRNTVQRKYF